jgi:malate dehydrogenase
MKTADPLIPSRSGAEILPQLHPSPFPHNLCIRFGERKAIMRRAKISIIGAGNVGATAAHWAVAKELGDIVLVDIPETKGMPAGKALDLYQASPVEGFDAKITGATSYEPTADSDVVIVTAGLPRKPGMSRDDLISVNTGIVKQVAQSVARHSPNAVMIVVSNPLDAMVYVAWKASGFPTQRIVGQAGVLDTARYRAFLAAEIGCSVEDVHALLLGGHGDDMVPLPRYTFAGGIPVTQLIPKDRLEQIIQRTRNGGAEIVQLLEKGSAYYAPAAATVAMAESIIKDKKRILPCAAYCQKEYNVGGYFVGVPCVLGSAGVERVIEIELDEAERKMFQSSVDHVKELIRVVKI